MAKSGGEVGASMKCSGARGGGDCAGARCALGTGAHPPLQWFREPHGQTSRQSAHRFRSTPGDPDARPAPESHRGDLKESEVRRRRRRAWASGGVLRHGRGRFRRVPVLRPAVLLALGADHGDKVIHPRPAGCVQRAMKPMTMSPIHPHAGPPKRRNNRLIEVRFRRAAPPPSRYMSLERRQAPCQHARKTPKNFTRCTVIF